MPSIVSTGQITIVDQNDAKPILAVLSANSSIQQVYSKDNGVETHIPNWTSTPIILTAAVYVGGVNMVNDASCSSKVWSTTFNGTSIASTTSFTRNTNLTPAAPSQDYYFRCTYQDPETGIQSRVDAHISLSQVQTGSNAVYVQLQGGEAIKKTTGSAATNGSRTAVKAVLVRSSGIDADNLQYRWYSIDSAGVRTKLHSAVVGVGNYAVKSTAIVNAPDTTATLGSSTFTTAAMTSAGVTTADADWCTAGAPGFNTLVIAEGAVTGSRMFQVEIRDTAEGAVATRPVYTAYFIVVDVSDPMTLEVFADGGDRLLNGVGGTQMSVKVYSGQNEIASYTGWGFDWYLWNKDNQRVGWVQSSGLTPTSTRAITTNTATVINVGTSETYTAGELLKLVNSTGTIVAFAQVAATVTGSSVTIGAATGNNANCNAVATLTAGQFDGGTVYKAIAKKSSTTGSKIGPMVTQFDIDGKNTVRVDALKPD